jgi:hypothetical protein
VFEGGIGRREYASLDLWSSDQESVFLFLVGCIRERGKGVDGPEVERWNEVRNAVANDQVVVVDIGRWLK